MSRRFINIYPTDTVVSIIPESVITSEMLEKLRIGVNRWDLRFEPHEGKILLAHNNICVLLGAMYMLGQMGVKFNGCTCGSGSVLLEIVDALSKQPTEVK